MTPLPLYVDPDVLREGVARLATAVAGVQVVIPRLPAVRRPDSR